MGNLNTSGNSNNGYGVAPARQRVDTAAAETRKVFAEGPFGPKPTGYGLPCAHCKTYYAADLAACPICKNPQRVSPTAALPTAAPAEQLPDPEQLEKERDRFLRELNSQVIVSPVSAETTATARNCIHLENHSASPEPASICQGCYDRLQERVDVLEAAMHMDIKEASQIIYDAVWSDPSDPSKTYQNAAQALLGELRRRSGTTQVFGPLQPGMN
jgi:hypothetical protein